MQRWDDLRVFLALVEAGTFAGAAGILGVNASTVLRRVRTLEDELGATLFERGARGTNLTPAGEALLPKAREVEEAAHAARRSVVGHDRQVAGPVRLTLVEDILPVVVPILVSFREAVPGVVPTLSVAAEMLQIGRETDVALRLGGEIPTSAVARRLATVSWAVYTSVPDDGSAGPDAGLPWLGYAGLDAVPAVQWYRQHRGEEPEAMLVDGVSAMHRTLRRAPARALLPCHLGDPDRRLRRLQGPVPGVDSSLWLLIHADLRRSARVRALVDFMVPRILDQRSLFDGTGPSAAPA